nr:UDP glucuronosyltransferase 1 family polypeptide b5 short isoform [Danio rerio]
MHGVIFNLVVGVVCSAAMNQKPSRNSNWTGKLLVVPMDGSHWTGVKAVAEEMGRRGHTVIVVIPEISMRLGPGKHYITKRFPVKYKPDVLNQMIAKLVNTLSAPEQSLLKRVTSNIYNFGKVVDYFISTTESLFQEQELIEFLRDQNFDAVLTDPAMPMGAILAYNLSVPAVYMLRGLMCESKATACPDPPSYIPRLFTQNSDHMNFGERLMNTLASLMEPLMCKLKFSAFEEVTSKFLHRDVSMTEILSTGAVWLMRYDFTLEFPKPLMPNIINIGGINCEVNNPLTKVSITIVRV